jgi:NDP-hexose 4-ketoreductase
MTEPVRVLLLGAGGFIGAHVLEAFGRSDRATDVTAVARSEPVGGTTTAWRRLDLVEAGTTGLIRLLEDVRPAVVVNCAGRTRGDALDLVRANVVLVANLVAALRSVSPAATLVHLGSSAEYGAVPEGVPILETAPPAPVAPYGVTKLAATELVLAGARADDSRAIVLRVFNPIGSGQPVNTLPAAAVLAIREALRTGGTVTLGRLDDHRDFVDVADVADAVVAVSLSAGRIVRPILNVGSGRATLARDLVATLADVAGYRGRIEEAAIDSERSSGVPWQQADIGAIEAAAGWRPRRDLRASAEALWSGIAGTPEGGSGENDS